MKKKKVLIAESDSFVASIMKVFVQKASLDLIAICRTEEEILKNCNANNPDMLLLDIKLEEDKDTIELAKRINEKYNFPIIFTGDSDSQELLKQITEIELYGYILKPINHTQIQRALTLASRKFEGHIPNRHNCPKKSTKQTLAIVKDGEIQHVSNLNSKIVTESGIKSTDEAIGKPITDIIGFESYQEILVHLEPILNETKSTEPITHNITLRTGNTYRVNSCISVVMFKKEVALCIVFNDVD